MPKVIIQIMGVAPSGRPPPVPTWVKDADFDADGGRGFIAMTQKKGEAKRFEDAGLAMEYYRTASKVVPLRPDGKPNRPMTAYHVSICDEDLPPL